VFQMVKTGSDRDGRRGNGWGRDSAFALPKLTERILLPMQMACVNFVTFTCHLWPGAVAAGRLRPYLRALT
jgi:hypothetical protein